MHDIPSPFYSYRYLVTPISQASLFPSEKTKEELTIDIFESIITNTKTVWNKGDKRYLLYGIQKTNDLYIIKFAKESTEKIFEEGDKDIEVKKIKEAKYVMVIVDTTLQIILIERNQSVFTEVTTVKELLADFLRQNMKSFDYVVNIYPLVSSKKFWSYVENADKIFELSLVLNAPNMLFGNKDTRDVLKSIKESTNSEIVEIGFKNKEGTLKLIKDSIGDMIDYVREVGGKYKLKYEKDGVKETQTSENDTAKTNIKKKKEENYSESEMTEIKEKTKNINSLEKRDEEDI